MKSRKILTCMTAMTLLSALAVPIRLAAQSHYSVVELGELGGNSGGANGINDRGWVTGTDNLPGNLTTVATLWVNGTAIPLGTLSGGPNSAVAWPVKSNNGVIVGISELPDIDPVGENFSCWPFLGGGFSSYATGVNNLGQVVGWAENGVHDPTCNTSFQILQFRAAIWQPDGTMQELPPLPGDSTSAAVAINDIGQVVGISGDCGVAVGSVSAKHAVLWQNGVPTDLGNIGGDAWNTPTAINNQGTIVGFANTVPGTARHYEAFIWTQAGGMKSLGKLPGDIRSVANGINEKGQIVGASRGAFPQAVLWENNKLFNLNSLAVSGSPFLLVAGDIDQQGQIVGEVFDSNTGDTPGFIATPVPPGAAVSSAVRATPESLPENVLRQIERRMGLGIFGIDPITPQ